MEHTWTANELFHTLEEEDMKQSLIKRTPCQKSKNTNILPGVIQSDAQTDQRCPVLEFTACETPRSEQAWSMSPYQNKIAVCAAEEDFKRSPNPAVPSL